jgi:catechol 2,3-dioxygenase-like lactoylglutathione lyase family enzyme
LLLAARALRLRSHDNARLNVKGLSMAIVGIESLLYGVQDLDASTRFFEDFGLPLVQETPNEARFRLEEGSTVVIRHIDDASIPKSAVEGIGVREVTWGVDTQANLDRLAAELKRDRELTRDADGTVHFLTDTGLPMALHVFAKRAIVYAPDPVNAPGRVNRLNQHRKWRLRARPKVIQHVVFAVPEVQKSFEFFRDRLQFRLSDAQRGVGLYARADGTNNHHNIFFLDANAHFPGLDGRTRFHHVNFGVEDIDEIMVGANHMERCGWQKSVLGLGRHRIDSALFYYLPCPAGGEAEYGADADYVDDNWVPRDWVEPLFGYIFFAHNLPPFLQNPPAWEVKYLEGHTPKRADQAQ